MSRSRYSPPFSARCCSGRKCTYCGPVAAVARRDAVAPTVAEGVADTDGWMLYDDNCLWDGACDFSDYDSSGDDGFFAASKPLRVPLIEVARAA